MKKVLIFIIVFLSFSIFVYADDEISSEESNLSPKSQEQIKAADEATKSYCDSNSEVKGCLYNESDTKYTSITKNFSFTRYENVHGNNSKPVTTKFSVENVPLTRGYQAFNGNGEAIFAGCYKYVYNPAKLPDNPAFVTGDTIFFFKFIFGKNCKEKHLYVVPAEGTRNRISTTSETATYDGTKAIVTSAHLFQFATFNEWKATRDAACPNIFGYTSNTRWYTSSDHIYVFSNNSSDFDELKAYSFWKNEEYKTRPGCTVSDEAGENENQVLLDEILNDIKGRTCPAKIEDMKTMNEEMQEWYESLRNNNKYRELWSRSLSDEVTVNDVQNQILAAIKEKLNSCMYNICGLTSSEITTINSKKGSACKNGCTLHRSETQSNSENAQCYACDNDKVLTWTENPNKNTCELQKNLKKEQCIGTLGDYQCRTCLYTAFNNSNLSEEKKSCLLTNELAMELTLQNLALANQAAAENDVETEMEENAELRENLFNGKVEIVELFIDDTPMTCSEILDEPLLTIVKGGITIVQIAAAIIAIVKGMLILVPAITAKDADGLKKASKTLVILAVILALVVIFRPLVKMIGHLLDYDVTCIV